MTTISSYTTQSGVRYRVRYRKPDGSQTDKRGFKRKRDAEQWAARQTWRLRAMAGLFGFMPDAPPFVSRQIPNRWNLADSWPLPYVRRRFGQTNFGVRFGVGSE